MKTPTEIINDLDLYIEATFIPWSKSRNSGEKYPSLNYSVKVSRNGKPFITTDYTMGTAYVPGNNQSDNTVHHANLVKQACEVNGHVTELGVVKTNTQPSTEGVFYSLVMDANVLNYSNFEDWAHAFGYSEDSRSAEKIYKACLAIALALRNAVGDAGMAALSEAYQDY